MQLALDDTGVIVRVGGMADVQPVAAMALLSFDPRFRESWTDRQIASALTSLGGSLLLLERQDALIGFALSRRIFDESELLLCAIAPEHRLIGAGRALMRAVERDGQNAGVARIFLEVRESNHAARALYRSCGYQESGRRSSYYLDNMGNAIDAITMSLMLGDSQHRKNPVAF